MRDEGADGAGNLLGRCGESRDEEHGRKSQECFGSGIARGEDGTPQMGPLVSRGYAICASAYGRHMRCRERGGRVTLVPLPGCNRRVRDIWQSGPDGSGWLDLIPMVECGLTVPYVRDVIARSLQK